MFKLKEVDMVYILLMALGVCFMLLIMNLRLNDDLQKGTNVKQELNKNEQSKVNKSKVNKSNEVTKI